MKKNRFIILILFSFCIFLTSIFFSKYISNFVKEIVLNTRKAEYDVVFNQLLPDEYQEVEYIESTGTQWIDTGFTPTEKTKMQFKFRNLEITGNVILGFRHSNDLKDYRFFNANGKAYLDFPGGSGSGTRIIGNDNSIKAGVDYSLELGNYYIKNLDTGAMIASGSKQPAFKAERTVTLNYFEYDHAISKNRVYSLKIFENENLVRNFIPCYRKSDNVAGLYDMVTKTFYTNNGTGAFITGTNIENKYHEAKTQHFVYGTAQNLEENNYIREYYTFKEWNTKSDGTGTSYADKQSVNKLTKIDGDVVNLYAQWLPKYIVTFDADGGEIPAGSAWTGSGETANKAVTYSKTYDALPTPTKEGYTFMGWNGKNMLNIEDRIEKSAGAWSNTTKRDFTGNGIYLGLTRNNYYSPNNIDDYRILSDNSYCFTTKSSGYNLAFDVKVDPSKKYILSTKNNSNYLYMGLYQSDGTYINNYDRYIETTEDTSYVAIAPYADVNKETCYYNLQLEEGEEATTYEPYYIKSDTEVVQNKDHTLKAIWKPNTYKVNYHNVLPSDYQQVEYIESTGTQYIDTEVKMSSSKSFETKFKYSDEAFNSTTGDTQLLVGAYDGGSVNANPLSLFKAGSFYFVTHTHSSGRAIRFSLADSNIHTVKWNMERNYASLDDTYRVGITTGNSNASWYLFAANYPAGVTMHAKARIYYMKIYDNDSLIRDYIPCYRKEDGRIGLYDLVENKFYTNPGEDNFLKGDNLNGSMTTQDFIYDVTDNLNTNEYTKEGYTFNGWNTKQDGSGTSYSDGQSVNNLISINEGILDLYAQWKANEYDVVFNSILPNEYQEVEYIESTGTQYIRTDIIPSSNFRVVADLYLTANMTSELAFIGSRNGDYAIEGYFVSGVPKFWINNSNSVSISAEESYYNKMLHYDAKATPSNISLEIDSSKTYSTDTSYSGVNRGLGIFSYIREDGPRYNFRGRIYSLKIYDNDILISNFIPCYRTDDNAIGLYDLVNAKFYTNNGSGTFIKGSDIENAYHEVKTQHFVYGLSQNLISNTYTDIEQGYEFIEWNTSSYATGTGYLDEEEVNNLTNTDGEVVNLYAIYEKKLSDEYSRLEYIESTGTQWIDTFVNVNSTIKYQIKLSVDSTTPSDIIGAGLINGEQQSFRFFNYNNIFYLDYGSGYKYNRIYGGTWNNNEVYELEIGNRYVKNLKTNTNIISSTAVSAFSYDASLKLFELYGGTARIYYMKIWDNNRLVRDFIPCYKNEDGISGLCDLLNDEFYQSEGIDDFIGY